MNIIDALRSEKPLKRPIPKHVGWLAHAFIKTKLLTNNNHAIIPITEIDLFANDWEVKEAEDAIQE